MVRRSASPLVDGTPVPSYVSTCSKYVKRFWNPADIQSSAMRIGQGCPEINRPFSEPDGLGYRWWPPEYVSYVICVQQQSNQVHYKVLFIPCQLIWSIKIRLFQKIALSASLCLTDLTVVCTITRKTGVQTGNTVKFLDSVWVTYWCFIAASLALTMTAATAFRTSFVSRVKYRRALSPGSKETWLSKGKRLLRSWRSQPHSHSSSTPHRSDRLLKLHNQIPKATMTGVRTFISGQGKTEAQNSQTMQSIAEEECISEGPLKSKKGGSMGDIHVQHDITLVAEDACWLWTAPRG